MCAMHRPLPFSLTKYYYYFRSLIVLLISIFMAWLRFLRRDIASNDCTIAMHVHAKCSRNDANIVCTVYLQLTVKQRKRKAEQRLESRFAKIACVIRFLKIESDDLKRAERRSHLVMFVNEYAFELIVISNALAHSAVAEMMLGKSLGSADNKSKIFLRIMRIRFQPQNRSNYERYPLQTLVGSRLFYERKLKTITCSAVAITTATRRFYFDSHTSCTNELFIFSFRWSCCGCFCCGCGYDCG